MRGPTHLRHEREQQRIIEAFWVKVFTLGQTDGTPLPRVDPVMLFPKPAPRRYVSCPRCESPHAFVTLERVETQCCFCPLCKYLWDTLRASLRTVRASS